MRKHCFLAALLLTLVFTLAGCGDPGVIYSTPHVYLSGYVTTGVAVRATYWRDTVPVTLDTTDDASVANAVAVSGTDVYAAGSFSNGGGNSTVTLWKNGVANRLTDGTKNGAAFGIALAGSDVYVSGSVGTLGNYYSYTATYWKNGTAVALPSGSLGAGTYGMAVSGNDVYVVGWTYKSSPLYGVPITIGTLWKNGVPTFLTDTSRSSMGNGLFVSGSDVYVAGYVADQDGNNRQAVYWKNGVQVTLPSVAMSTGADANGIAVSGMDVYVSGDVIKSGSMGSSAGFWKNGTFTEVTGNDTGPLAVSGTDVFMGGQNFTRYLSNGKLDPDVGAWQGATSYSNGVAMPLAPNALTSGVFGIALAY